MTRKLLQEFKKLYKETKDIIDTFPLGKREKILFGRWSLKDVVAHFNHWAEHDLLCFKALREGKEPSWVPDVDDYNAEGVEIRKKRLGKRSIKNLIHY